MKQYNLIFLLIFPLFLNGQSYKTFLKIVNPIIKGGSIDPLCRSCFEIQRMTYKIQTIGNKVQPGIININVKHNSEIVNVLKEFHQLNDFDIEISFLVQSGDISSLVNTIKLKKSYINAIKLNYDNIDVGFVSIDLWMNEFAFEYIFTNKNGIVESKHSAGWSFQKNIPISF